MNLEKLLINPVRIMILQYLTLNETATTSEIISNLKNVSRATIYNHIKILEENDLICVVQENQIRGTLEKVYSIKKNEGNNNSDYASVTNYLLYLMVDFHNYFDNSQNEMNRDMLFVDRTVMYLDDKNYKMFFTEYEELCKKYFSLECDEINKGRTISLISSPFMNGEKE